ncbi:MAG: ABC transporter permease subunit [Candidatus Hodarchaeales archaeon]|jgi:ABC-type Na+ efflux pump permease subunit
MNYRKAFIIARKEIWEIWTTKLILWSTVGIAAVLGIGMPLMVIAMPLAENLYYYKLMMVSVVGAINMMIGFILPIYVAADSFVGEKERRTLERLLAIPLTDQEILLGKMTTCVLPTTILAWITITVSSIITWISGMVQLEGVDPAILINSLFPSPVYFIAEIIIAFFGAVAATSIMVLVSTRVNNLREATQAGGVVLLPMIGVVYTQAAGFLIPENALPGQIFEGTAIAICVVFMVVAILAFYLARLTFSREKLVAKL